MYKIIETSKSPKAIGPYNQGIIIDNFIFTSGQIGVNPISGDIQKSIDEQTYQCLENIKNIIESGEMAISNIVKVNIFMRNLEDFGKVNSIYEHFFKKYYSAYPARSCVEVTRLPKDVEIEIEAIAYKS